jgi:hypothetical protein
MSKRVKSIFGRMNRVARVTHDFTDDVASILIVLDNEDGSSTFSSRFLLGARMRLSMSLPVYALLSGMRLSGVDPARSANVTPFSVHAGLFPGRCRVLFQTRRMVPVPPYQIARLHHGQL